MRIKGGRVIDPSRHLDQVGDVFVSNGIIVSELHPNQPTEVIDATGHWVVPGLIDAHVHLREPGGEHKETIETGLRAAARGGFTAVLPMPNTNPPNDNPTVTRMMIDRAKDLGGTRCYPVAAVTKGRQGDRLSPMADLIRAGAVAFSDDGSAVADDTVMRSALEMCQDLGVPLAQHAEDPVLSSGGVIHDGDVSQQLGLPGWPAAAETSIVARDIALAEQTGAHLHISHISTAQAIDLVRRSKAAGLAVTAEVTPHHLHLTDETAVTVGTLAKVNPPLRTAEDRAACQAGLTDGTIDMVATDHAPHTAADKGSDFQQAAFGMVGLEISLPLLLILVHRGVLSPLQLIHAMSTAPARVFSLPGGTLAHGAPADITLIHPGLPFTIAPETFESKGRNTPFGGWQVPGRAVHTIVAGRTAYLLAA